MIENKKISLVVPCRNEGKIIAEFIRKVPAYIDEIIIVDNNSTDNTAAVANAHGALVVKERRTTNGIGYGFAHMAGMAKATGDFIIAMDGDDTYPVGQIKRIVTLMGKNHWDFVSCNRLPLTYPKAISPTRQLGIRILNRLVFLLYGYHMSDILTGMWVVRRVVVPRLNLSEGDWNFSPEIKLAALAAPGVSFAQYHIVHFLREQEISKQNILKTGLSHMGYIVKRRLTTDNIFMGLLTQKVPFAFEKTYE